MVALGAGSTFAVLAFALCLLAVQSTAEPMTAIKLEKGRRDSKTVRPGDVVEIRLPAIPGTGYSWHVEASDPNVLVLLDKRFEHRTNDAPRVGATVDQVITLKAVGEGKAEVTLSYRRPWEKPAPTDDTAALNVTVAK
jgi:predicted secreted protein